MGSPGVAVGYASLLCAVLEQLVRRLLFRVEGIKLLRDANVRLAIVPY